MDPQRAARILAALAEEGLVEDGEISLPRRASVNHLLRVHTSAYVESLQRREAMVPILGFAVDERQREEIVDLQRRMTGGTIQATRLALTTGNIGVNLGGGFHHAMPNHGQGFCIFNDIAVAIQRLRAHGFRAPILVIDLDLHDGNGTRAIFADDPTVHTYSVHNAHWGETEAAASTSIELGTGVTDEVYLGTLVKTLPPVVEQLKPGLAIYVAGCDVAADDRIGDWQISPDGMLARDQLVTEVLRRRGHVVPVAVVLAGGYGSRAWRYTARFLFWLMTGGTTEVPENDELTLMRVHRAWGQLDRGELTSDPGDFILRLTEEDLDGIVPGAPGSSRFLGYFSRHGVELLLEKLGIFAQLRARGYHNPMLELDSSHELGDRLRLWSDARKAELLMELLVGRNQRMIPGMEVLTIEWLLLQNPRARFSPDRPPLPGQQHPGLGMLTDVLGWLVSISEMLHLDGVTYVPSHYHVAAQSRKLVRFLKPGDEALFRAIEALLAGVPLHEATRRVENGEVLDAGTREPVSWGRRAMVLPVSERLRDLLFSEQYEQEVERQLAALHLCLRGLQCPGDV